MIMQKSSVNVFGTILSVLDPASVSDTCCPWNTCEELYEAMKTLIHDHGGGRCVLLSTEH